MFISDFSYLDPMTSVLTKKCALPLFEATFNEKISERQELAFLFLDIDHLKKINDKGSRSNGDKAIRVVANVLSDLWTSRTIPSRFGGEEYLIMLVGYDQGKSREFAEKLVLTIANKVFPAFDTGEPMSVSISVGMTNIETLGDSFYDALRRADEALNDAKNLGRNQVQVRQKISQNI